MGRLGRKGEAMSLCRDIRLINRSRNTAFDAKIVAEMAAPWSGIYRCPGCGREVVARKGETLPPASHHHHDITQGDVRWQLVVAAEESVEPNRDGSGD
jgi:hypothetical protein